VHKSRQAALFKLSMHKKKKFANLKSTIVKKLIFAPFHHLSSVFEMVIAKAKEILTRVGFEPTPFRTSVLEEP